jgi:hypothetical protein
MSKMSQVLTGILFAAPIGLVTLLSTDASAHARPVGQVETVALFDADALEAPESIVVDRHNNKYVSMVLTGEIRKIAPDGTQSTYAMLFADDELPLTPCGPFINGLTALALDHQDNLYANVASCDLDHRGIWKIPNDGVPERIAALPLESLPNGIVVHNGYVYAADSFGEVIWRAPADGGTAEVWATGEELERDEFNGFPGPNGLQFYHDELYVANSSKALIVAYRLESDGSAGPARIHATGAPCDDFAFDVHGNLYCGTDPFETVLKITPDGSVETLLSFDDGLDGPSSAAFGRHGDDRFELYITNGAVPFFPGQTPRRPSLMRVSLDAPGAPRL